MHQHYSEMAEYFAQQARNCRNIARAAEEDGFDATEELEDAEIWAARRDLARNYEWRALEG